MAQSVQKFAYIVLLFVLGAAEVPAAEKIIVHGFRDYNSRQTAEKMHLVGEILAKGRMQSAKAKKIELGYDMREGKVDVKIASPEGLQVGQLLYIVRKNPDHRRYKSALIVGQMNIHSFTKTSFAGWILTGTGHFRNVKVGDFIAKTFGNTDFQGAVVLKSQGDYHFFNRRYGQAIAKFKQAIKLNPNYPEAYLAMGKTYGMDSNNLIAAENAFQSAYKHRRLTATRRARFEIYDEYFRILSLRHRTKNLETSGSPPEPVRKRLLIIKEVAGKARAEFPDSKTFRLHGLWSDYYDWSFKSAAQIRGGKAARAAFDKSHQQLLKKLAKHKDLLKDPAGLLLNIKVHYADFRNKTVGLYESVNRPAKVKKEGCRLIEQSREYLRYQHTPKAEQRRVNGILSHITSYMGQGNQYCGF